MLDQTAPEARRTLSCEVQPMAPAPEFDEYAPEARRTLSCEVQLMAPAVLCSDWVLCFARLWILDYRAMSLIEPEFDEDAYNRCLNWISVQSEDFRCRLLADLQRLRLSSGDPDISTPYISTIPEVLPGEVKNTEWGQVTEYMRPLSGPFKFPGSDGVVHEHDPQRGLHFHHGMPEHSRGVWYFVGCINCCRFAVTFPDNGGSWSHALRSLGWRGKRWASAFCHECK